MSFTTFAAVAGYDTTWDRGAQRRIDTIIPLARRSQPFGHRPTRSTTTTTTGTSMSIPVRAETATPPPTPRRSRRTEAQVDHRRNELASITRPSDRRSSGRATRRDTSRAERRGGQEFGEQPAVLHRATSSPPRHYSLADRSCFFDLFPAWSADLQHDRATSSSPQARAGVATGSWTCPARRRT